MDTTVVNPTLVEQITTLSSLNQIIETIFVDSEFGTIQVNKTIKDSDTIKNIDQVYPYKLNSTRLIIKSDDRLTKNLMISDIDRETIVNDRSICECVARNTNNIFSKEFSKIKNVVKHKINYFQQGFFKKLFNPTDKKKFFEKVNECSRGNSWMVIPPTITDLFSSLEGFEKFESECYFIIHQFGVYNEINVFLNPDQKENTIYFGNYESLTLIVNKNLKTSEIKTNSTTYTRGVSMEVSYLLIENDSITILEIE